MKLANVSQVQLTTHIYHHFSNLQIFQTSINSCIFEKPLRLSTYDFFAQHQPSPNHLWPSFAHSLLLFPFWLHQNIYYLASGLWQINKFNISLQYMKQKVCAPPRMKIKCLGQSVPRISNNKFNQTRHYNSWIKGNQFASDTYTADKC